jgi:hypothetical protein
MVKKYVMVIIAVYAVMSLLFADEKKDTTSSSGSITISQTTDKTLSKQTNIKPKPQSSWSKIKDLFM